MAARNYQVAVHIENTPEAVIKYVADVRNRPLFFPSLKSVSDIKGDPSAVGTTWRWTFVALATEFQGTARCLEHQPGKLYSFQTAGGIESKFTYRAQPDKKGTKLTIDLEYTIPQPMESRLPTTKIADAMKKAEADQVIQNLKVILDK